MNTARKMLRARRWPRAVVAGVLLSGLFASPVGADPEITPDPLQVPSAVSPPSPDVLEDGKRDLKLDYSRVSPGLHIVLRPPGDEEKQSLAQSDSKRRVIGFHRAMPAGFKGDLSPQLDWTEEADGSFVASLRVTSPEAGSVRVGIRAELPPGGEIRFFAEHSDERFPVVTREDFPMLGDEMQTLWSPTVDGDSIGIEVTLPSEQAVGAFWLRIDAVSHSPWSMSSLHTAAKLDCPGIHIDVQCRSSSTHSTLEDAVALIGFEEGGLSYLCSGVLMNDAVEGSFIPYFLTANHCVSAGGVARTVEAWWFYQRARCGGSSRDSRFARTTSGTNLLATRAASDITLLRFRGSLPGGLTYSGWTGRSIAHPAGVYGVHHPAGALKKYSAGATTRTAFSEGVVNAIGVRWSEGTTEGGSSGSGLFLEDGGYLVGALSHGPACGHKITDKYGPFRDFLPDASHWLAPDDGGTLGAADVVLPLVTEAANLQQQGFVRVINRSNQSGNVRIHAIDNTGRRFGPATLFLRAKASKNFNSGDMERGNSSLGLEGGVGSGTGDWRVELRADFSIEARAYVRTPDGFLTAMHKVAKETSAGSSRYHLPFFNPASNTALVSLLRVVNPGTSTANVVISGVDARGNDAPLGDVRLSLDGGGARLLSAQELERGVDGVQGRLGDGRGKWQLYVSSNRPLLVLGLMRTRSGHLSNLSE